MNWNEDLVDEAPQDDGNGKSVREEITNIMNSQYLGEIYFGNNNSMNATVVFDTGSAWLTVKSEF
jgi:hypothetical protein